MGEKKIYFRNVTPEQFRDEFVKDYDGVAALRRCGMTGKYNTLATRVYRLMRTPVMRELFRDEAVVEKYRAAKSKRLSEGQKVASLALSEQAVIKREAERTAVARAVKNVGVQVEQVLREAMRLAFVDPVNLFNEDGSLKAVQDMPEDTRRCIASIEVLEEFEGFGKDRTQIGYTKKVKFWDKNQSLDKLFRYLSLYNDVGTKNNPLTMQKEEHIDVSKLKPDDIAQLSEMLKRVMKPIQETIPDAGNS